MSTIQTIESLRASIAGTLIEPDHPEYDDARKVHNGMIDKRPGLIARCANAADVAAVARFASSNGMILAVRGGGHSGAGLGTCDGGVLIDLSGMRGVSVDPTARTARVAGGSTWGDVDAATAPFGLSVPCGIISTTGVGGLTLGGGHGYLTRKYGLTIDNLLGADVVLADGSQVTANATEHPDLFWALRGGGGNFGVVTSFLFQARPVSAIVGGPMLWPLGEAAKMMRFFTDALADIPEDIYGFFATLVVPPVPPFPEALHLTKACGIVWCSLADEQTTASVLDRFRAHAAPSVDFVGPMTMPAINGMFDALYPKGLQMYWKGDFFSAVSDPAIALHVRHGAELPTMLSTMHMYPIDGAAARVGTDETAWSYRDATYSGVIVGVDADPANAPRVSAWARDYWQDLHPHSCGGAYVNFIGADEGQERVRSTYRDHYARLASIKGKYDPQNLFRVNHNIWPA